jgi:predicted TPR repeat methyltransferase
MAQNKYASGDGTADRRADYARMLAESGDYAAAAELTEQALELVPQWTAGWFKLGEYNEKAGFRPKAILAYEKVTEFDHDGIFAAALKLAVLGATETPDQPPSRYVEGLFDDYADRFESSLVDKLGYSIPKKLGEIIATAASARPDDFRCAVDIGCGTGLMGMEIRNVTQRLEGFDISANMLEKAAEKRIYDHLAQADLSLDADACGLFADDLPKARADLVVAADVAMYLGNLEPVMMLVSTLLETGGIFAVTAEDSDEVDGFILQPSLRYAHSERYVTDLFARYGFDLMESTKTAIRKDAGKQLPGILFLARKAL